MEGAEHEEDGQRDVANECNNNKHIQWLQISTANTAFRNLLNSKDQLEDAIMTVLEHVPLCQERMRTHNNSRTDMATYIAPCMALVIVQVLETHDMAICSAQCQSAAVRSMHAQTLPSCHEQFRHTWH
jgi:hypothetical protein